MRDEAKVVNGVTYRPPVWAQVTCNGVRSQAAVRQSILVYRP
jgi:hypothetical protein